MDMENQYEYHTREEWESRVMKFNPKCPICLKGKGKKG